MLKSELNQAVENFLVQTREALQTVYDALNHGQQKQIIKDEKVKALLDLNGVVDGV